MTRATRTTALLLSALVGGCGAGLRMFPLRAPMQVDADMRPFSPMPERYKSPFVWDAVDQTIFYPTSRFFAVDPGGEAVNVNAFDEVPDSSWFTNRIGVRPMSLEEYVRAACDEPPLDPAGPWTVTAAKPNGYNPGFFIEDAHGRKFMVKFDGLTTGERATSADAIGSVFFWAVGYHAPCQDIVFFDKSILRIREGATAENADGEDVPLTMAYIEKALAKGLRTPDGRYRASSSQFLDGVPLGPWTYAGTRDDDPNDVVPHEDRREVRGAGILASWIGHFDTREQNTMATWIAVRGDAGYVRHYYMDFGSAFGSLWDWDGISRRLGHAYYLDIPYLVEDFLTLGLIRRPWESVELGPTGRTLGYFDVRHFEPDAWRPGYPNPAFGRQTERDAAWMARLIAELRDPYVAAAVDRGEWADRRGRDLLLRILLGRRDKLLRRWFRQLSPLTRPHLEPTLDGGGTRLCRRDLALYAGLVPRAHRPYRKRAWVVQPPSASEPTPVDLGAMSARAPDNVCVELPRVPGATRAAAAYLVVDVTGLDGPTDEDARPARVHLYQIGPNEYRIVGLERPDDDDPWGS